MTFAAETKVPISRTQEEIRKLIVEKHRGSHYGMMEEPNQVHVVFRLVERNIRFTLPMPARPQRPAEIARHEKLLRSRWRALLLVIKAKLESVESKIETFEEAFFAHVVMPGGETVYEQLKEPLRLRYQDNSNIPLLAPPKGN